MNIKPFQTTGLSMGRIIGNNNNATDYEVGIFPSENGELLFRDNYVRRVLGVDAISLKELYMKSQGIFYRDDKLYFKDGSISRPISLEEIVKSNRTLGENRNAGNLWWVGRQSIDHSNCANIPRQNNSRGINQLWSVDKFLSDVTGITNCDDSGAFSNKSINQETGEWLWWDVQNLEIVVPPIEDNNKMAIIMAKLAYITCNSSEPIVFRLYDATARRELTRTAVVQENKGKIAFPVTLNYFGPLTMSQKASNSITSNNFIDCSSQEEDCGCDDISCIEQDPSCALPSSNALIQSFNDNSHLIKVQFHVTKFDTNFYNRVFGIVDNTGEYFTRSNLDALVFDTSLNRKYTKQHGTINMNVETSKNVVLQLPLDTDQYTINLSCNKNINIWWSNKTGRGFTINSELPITGQVDWMITRINPQ